MQCDLDHQQWPSNDLYPSNISICACAEWRRGLAFYWWITSQSKSWSEGWTVSQFWWMCSRFAGLWFWMYVCMRMDMSYICFSLLCLYFLAGYHDDFVEYSAYHSIISYLIIHLSDEPQYINIKRSLFLYTVFPILHVHFRFNTVLFPPIFSHIHRLMATNDWFSMTLWTEWTLSIVTYLRVNTCRVKIMPRVSGKQLIEGWIQPNNESKLWVFSPNMRIISAIYNMVYRLCFCPLWTPLKGI